jgi:WD40 repeat protein
MKPEKTTNLPQVTDNDVSPDLKYVATASYDRTFKLWTSEQQGGL